MSCEQIQPNLLDYSKGLLTGSEYDEVEAHLAECEACAALLADEVAFAERLASAPEAAPANDVWVLVRAQTKPRRFRPLAWLQTLSASRVGRLAVVGAAAIALAAVLTFNPVENKPTPTQPTTVTVNWSDDPLGGHRDAVVELIDNM